MLLFFIIIYFGNVILDLSLFLLYNVILLPIICTIIESVCKEISSAISFIGASTVSKTFIFINSLAFNASFICFIKLSFIPNLPT